MKIGTCEIKNRIVMPPMMMGFGAPDGKPTEMLMDYYEERAKGGTGLILTEITRVNDDHGAAAFNQLAMSHDYHIEPMREFAERIHRHGAKFFVQLHHPGRQNVGIMVHMVPLTNMCSKVCKSFPKLVYKIAPGIGRKMVEKGLVFASPGPSKCEPSKVAGGHVRAFSHREIKKLIREFIDAAVRCKKAGVDGVELHAAHGYLLQQFLSPNTNKRTDEYGGSFENRLRFIKEIIEGIRKECGKDYPLIVRLAVDECYDKIGQPGKGYSLETGVKYAKAFEAMGVDAIDVSSAAYDTYNYWLEPTSFDCGWRAYMAEAVKKEVKIPVLAANLIRSPEQAEEQLERGVQDFVSLGRPHIADPRWAEKVQSGRENEVKRCICCLYCIESMMDNAYCGQHGCCSVNPTLGEERRWDTLPKDGKGRTVAIIGAGVAGLTAAEVLGKRGFKPVVFEKENVCGGQINLADKGPKKEKIGWCVEDLEVNARKQGADIRLGKEATAADIPPAISCPGMTSAEREAEREVSTRTAERGRVAEMSSFAPVGRASLPPQRKNTTKSIATETASDSTSATATPTAPVNAAKKPPASSMEKPIFSTSSTSSREEKARKFFLPQNQLRRGAYSEEVMSVGSMTRKMGMHLSSAKMPPRCREQARKTTQTAQEEISPMSRDAVVREFWRFTSPRAAHSATLRDSTVGAPAVKEKSRSSTLNAI